jgi:hypothetical protein
VVALDWGRSRRNISNIHREKPGEMSRKLSVKRRTKYLHIDGEKLGKMSRTLCQARDVISRQGDEVRNVELT